MAYTPRLTAPSESDPRWINVNYGGYNHCIVITSSGSVLPNCVGYVHGRWMEIGNTNTDYGLSLGNASTYYGNTGDGFQRGSEPKLGAIACYGGGSGGVGHVCIVEQIIDADTIVCSESDYGGPRFSVRTRYRSLGWRASSASTVVFQGFIYHPGVEGGGPEEKPYSLTINGGTAGTNAGAKGDKTTIRWTNVEGYRFTGWSLSGAGSIASPSSAVTEFTFGEGNATITANYAKIHIINIQGGTASPTTGIAGEHSVITASVPAGYYFKQWITNHGSIANLYAMTTTFTWDDYDAAISAVFGHVGGGGSGGIVMFVKHRNKYR